MPRLLRLLPLLLLLVLFAVLVLLASSSLTNADSFFHLRVGEHFLHDWTPWSPGYLNHFATRPWAPTQWLSEIVMAWFANHWGLAGVAWLSGLWFLALATVVYLTCRRVGSAVVAVAIALAVMIACQPSLSARPQVLSYILVAVTVDAWFCTSRDGRIRWWLIPLCWLWAMLHGMWLLGVVTSLVAALALMLQRPSPLSRRPARAIFVPLGMLVVAGVTPAGPRLYSAVFAVGTRSGVFDEWGPTRFTDPTNAVLAVMLATALLLALRHQRPDWLATALLVLSCAWAAYSERTLPIAAVTVAPLLASQLTPFTRPRESVSSPERLTIGAGLAAALVVLGFSSSVAGQIHQPTWVAPALRSLPQGTPVIADWQPAGYLTWAYPNLDPVMTGYADMYTDTELHEFIAMTELHPGWDAQVRRYGARVAVLAPKLPLAYALQHTLHWRVVHRSTDVELLVAPQGPAG